MKNHHIGEVKKDMSKGELILRELLAFAYSGSNLYGDDGELQDNRLPHPIDFFRDSPEKIRDAIQARGQEELYETLPYSLNIQANVRYWEDAAVNGEQDEDGKLIPLRNGDCWCPTIELATGRIIDWPQGTTARVHYKVCDAGCYYLLSPKGKVLASLEGDYVPGMLSPGGEGWGDYIIMDIDQYGVIQNWKTDLKEFDL